MRDVLGEEHALEFDHEEVDELLNVFERRFKGFAGYGVVAFWAEGGGETLGEDEATSNFGGGGCWRYVRRVVSKEG